jgi:hypothetical protein
MSAVIDAGERVKEVHIEGLVRTNAMAFIVLSRTILEGSINDRSRINSVSIVYFLPLGTFKDREALS